ncbi:MAG: ECF-type sigma factor [Pirellulaceae bacterium]
MGDGEQLTWLLFEGSGITSVRAEQIWADYFPRLMAFARKKMGVMPRRTLDEEDIALSALKSFFKGADAGRFELSGRDDLWRLLVTITARKVTQHRRHQLADKRGGGQVRGESVFHRVDDAEAVGLANVLDDNRLPEMADQVVAVCDELLNELGEEKLRQTALLRMEGYNNQEISEQLGCSVSRTKQRVSRIKELWSRHHPHDVAAE